MGLLDDLRRRFGVAAPTPSSPISNFSGTNPIEKALRISRGETFAPESFEIGRGLDQAVAGIGPEQDFLRGVFKGAELPGISVTGGFDPGSLVEARVVPQERAPGTGDTIDLLQEGAGEFLPLILGSGLAGVAATGSAGVSALTGSALGTGVESVLAGGLSGASGFLLAENVATGIAADAALDKPIGEGIVYSALGTGVFSGMAAAFKAGARLPKFALEQASEAQKNLNLRKLADEGIDPRAVDLANDMTEAGRSIDEVTGGATNVEGLLNNTIWKTQNARQDIRTLTRNLKQSMEEIVKQRNLTEILSTNSNLSIAAKTTVTGSIADLTAMDNALSKLGIESFGVLDRVSPTATLSERLAVLNGNVETFTEVSNRMGIPSQQLTKVQENISTRLASGASDEEVGALMFRSLEEQAQIGQLQSRVDDPAKFGRTTNLDVVNPNFNGVDAVAKQFFDLDVESRGDIMKVLQSFGYDTKDSALTKSLMDFDRRVQNFLRTTEAPAPTLPRIPVDEGDVLRGIIRTAPSKSAARRALTPGQEVGDFRFPDATSDIGLLPRAPNSRKTLANGIPLPTNAQDAALVRQTLFDISDLYMTSKPHLAIHALHTLKNFDATQKEFVAGVEELGRELGAIEGPLGAFARERFTLQGEKLGTRLLLSDALDGISAHYPELSPGTAREIFGDRTVERAVLLEGVRKGPHAKAINARGGTQTQEMLRRSFRATLRHEFGHEFEKALENGGRSDIARQIRLAAHRQPYRNDDWSFREMTGAPMGPRNRWVQAHGEDPIVESVAELMALLMHTEGRKHIHPDARAILEGIGIRIKEPYTPNRPAFQAGPGPVRFGAPVDTSEIIERSPFADTFKNIGDASPAKAPQASTAGNAAVGPRQLQAQREETLTNAIAALSSVRRVGGGPEKQIGLFTEIADEGLRLSKPSKQVQDRISKQLDALGSDAVQTFNESLITLPRSAQGKFVQRFLEDGPKILNREITDYTRAMREWRASAMLFGPSTWMANIFSTMLNTAVRPLTALAAAGIDTGRAALTGSARTRFATDALAEVAGVIQGARDAVHFIKSDIQKLRGKQPVSQNAAQELFETGAVLRQGRAREAVFQGSDASFLLAKGIKTRNLSRTIGGGIQVPFQILRISDNALYNMNFTGEMYRLSANELRRQGKAFSLSEVSKIVEGKALSSASVRKRAGEFAEAELQRNFGEGYLRSDGSLPVPIKALRDDMVQKALLDAVPQDIRQAKQIAERTIFVARETGQIDKVLSKLDDFDDTIGGAVSVALPFRRTPMNLIREGIRTSPLGFLATPLPGNVPGLSPATELVSQFVGTAPRNAEELVDAYAQAAVGTLLYAGMTAAAMYGVLEGNPEHFEQNRAVRTTMLADGRLPETVFLNIGEGKKLSIPLSRLQPIGGLILGALRASETIQDEGLKTIRPDILFGTQVDFIKSLGLQDQVEGTADFLEALVSDDPRLNFAERFGASFVPSFIRQGRQALGIEQGRSAKATEANALTRFAQGLQAGAFNSGLPRLGLFGEPLKRTPVLGAAGVGTVGRDPIVVAMIDAGSFHQAPDLLPQLRDEDPRVKNSFIRGKGQLQKQFVRRAIERIPNFAELPQERRKRIIDAAFNRGSAVANRRGKSALRNGSLITPNLILKGKIGL